MNKGEWIRFLEELPCDDLTDVVLVPIDEKHPTAFMGMEMKMETTTWDAKHGREEWWVPDKSTILHEKDLTRVVMVKIRRG